VTSQTLEPQRQLVVPRPLRTFRLQPSLVVTPAVVGHRGASGLRPEHTIEAYRLAIAQGVDDIELDLVPTKDGVLVARHESEISGTTDVAAHPEFADRRTTKVIDGEELDGWFVEDFTLAELKVLTARERLPGLRPQNTEYDGRSGIPTFNEVLAMVHAESVRHRRSIGVMAELKHASYFDSIGLPLDVALLADLRRHGVDHARSRVTVMAFESTILRRLFGRTRVPVIQLLEEPERRPADRSDLTYAELATPDGLEFIDSYADGIGAHRGLVLPRDEEGAIGTPSSLVRDAHRRWLTVHVWTLRAEAKFLPAGLDLAAEARAFLAAGVDGLITDNPDVVLAARDG
jgi:glycerophosphoryl diester phosphodiesterase